MRFKKLLVKVRLRQEDKKVLPVSFIEKIEDNHVSRTLVFKFKNRLYTYVWNDNGDVGFSLIKHKDEIIVDDELQEVGRLLCTYIKQCSTPSIPVDITEL